MTDIIDMIKDALLGDDKPVRKPYQSGAKVPTRTEQMCAAGDENACVEVERMKKAQTTDGSN